MQILLISSSGVFTVSVRRGIIISGHQSGQLPDLASALALQAGTPDAFGLAPGQGPDRPGPPGAVELPSVAPAGGAAIVPVIGTAHAATIRDISL
jgi:hypothetical protein